MAGAGSRLLARGCTQTNALNGRGMESADKHDMKPNPSSKPRAVPDTRFRHVLVPTDLTERTDTALQFAGTLAGRDGARVTLLHVIATIDALQFDELKTFYEELARKARARMTMLVGHFDGPQPTCTVVYGRRAEEIVGFATSNDVDLIILASHRVKPTGIDRDWGTISHKVGILAQCPVLLVK